MHGPLLPSMCALLVLSSACSSPEPESAPAPQPHEPHAFATEALEPWTCGTIERLHTQGGVYLASQPAPEDFRDAKLGGSMLADHLLRRANRLAKEIQPGAKQALGDVLG